VVEWIEVSLDETYIVGGETQFENMKKMLLQGFDIDGSEKIIKKRVKNLFR
jgi:hypothetical protein